MRVRLTRKLADRLDGVDVSGHEVGDLLELTARDARLLVAEQWAIPERRSGSGPAPPVERRRADDPRWFVRSPDQSPPSNR
jgi:hypothetical protein